MAANIEIRKINGKEVASYIENGKQERAWHRLGTPFDGRLTVKEALEQSHANFTVEPRTIFFMKPQLQELLAKGDDITPTQLRNFLKCIDNKQANVRTDLDECLGVVSDTYGIVQNADAFDFVNMLTTGEMGGETPVIETAGVLGSGERIFITAKFPKPIVMDNGKDTIDMYIVFTTSHDGTGAVTCMITPVRVVCNNTLNYALAHNSGKLCLRHTANVLDRLDLRDKENAKMAYSALNLYNSYKTEFEEKLNKLSTVRLSDKQIEQTLVKSLLTPEIQKIYSLNGGKLDDDDISTRSRNLILNVTDAIHSGVGQSSAQAGTGLWVMNGLTTFYQNHFDWKDEEKKFDSIMDGNVQKKVQKTYDLLMAA